MSERSVPSVNPLRGRGDVEGGSECCGGLVVLIYGGGKRGGGGGSELVGISGLGVRRVIG